MIKYIVASMLIIASPLLLQFPPAPYYPPTPYTTGVVVKVDGGVVVDSWKFYDTTPGTVNPTKTYPTSVTLGKSLPDPMNVCVEFPNGTLCVDIVRLRSLIEQDAKQSPQKKDK